MYFSFRSVFYFRRIYAGYPLQLFGVSAGVTLLTVLLSIVMLQHHRLLLLQGDKADLIKSKPTSKSHVLPRTRSIELPKSQGSALVRSFNSIAADIGIPVDDAAYMLNGADHSPYLQYQVSLRTKANYREMRKFLAVLSSEVPHATLNSVRCSRPNAVEPALGCELAFSAFFSKP